MSTICLESLRLWRSYNNKAQKSDSEKSWWRCTLRTDRANAKCWSGHREYTGPKRSTCLGWVQLTALGFRGKAHHQAAWELLHLFWEWRKWSCWTGCSGFEFRIRLSQCLELISWCCRSCDPLRFALHLQSIHYLFVLCRYQFILLRLPITMPHLSQISLQARSWNPKSWHSFHYPSALVLPWTSAIYFWDLSLIFL